METNDAEIDRIREGWSGLRARLQQTWDRLSNEDLAREDGDRAYVIAKVQEYYGCSAQEADQMVKDFERSL
jgi:uncharacterized protein YjbJ (UPF0337 family)